MGAHLDLLAVERHGDRGAEQRLVPLVVGMGDERHAGGEEFGSRGVDLDRVAPVGAGERDLVVGARTLAVLHLGLRDRGAEVDVPERRCLLAVGLAAGDVAQERPLAGTTRALVDGGVLVVPVDRQTEALEQVFEDLLVEFDQFVAELEEVRARDRNGVVVLRRVAAERGFEALDVVLAGVAAHPVVVLDAALSGQAVVVPAHRVEDGLAAHALEAGDRVGVGVAEHVAHVQRPAHGGRRRVDGEHALAGDRRVEAIRAVGVPLGSPALLDAVERRLVGDVRRRVGHRAPRLPTRPLTLPRTFALRSG